MRKTIFVILLILGLGYQTALAEKYSVKKGSTLTVNCTATAPAGYITHAFYNFVDQADAEYLGIGFNSSDLKVTYYGLKPKSNIKVEVTYAYTYLGTYDNNRHVGHGTYYDYITVTGAPDATRVEFREGDEITLRPGQSTTVHVNFYPSGADGWCDFGFVNGFGNPYNFTCTPSEDGTEALITAKKEGYVYLVALLYGKQEKVAIMTIKCSENVSSEEPKSIKITHPENLKLAKGEERIFGIQYTPSNSYSPVEWTSSDEKVITVDNKGTVTAVGAGTAVVSAKSENGLEDSVEIAVIPKVESFSLPASASVYLGYSYQLVPSIRPEGATPTLKWTSSDTSVATVSANGLVTAKRQGTATITVKCVDLDKTAEVEITVKRPDPKNDHRNAKSRIQTIKHLFNKTMITNK